MERPAWGIVLIKPQFEAGTARMRKHGRGGVIRDDAVRSEVVAEVVAGLGDLGLEVLGTHEAEPRGPKGNVEYVALIKLTRDAQ
jgi:23S rRNA (cytidine1920-2'-O)/16S rRNA (cytidine1409-2'-O)-methyltransferase